MSLGVNLNFKANTAKALGDFKRFSDSLDNKYLVSGLKLDLITSAIRQINREFQKSLGEQGLIGASSIRAAQNQAALLTATFKGFSTEAARAITKDISGALNKVAVTAGGTMADVRRTLAVTPFISTTLSNEDRMKMARQMMEVSRDMRRAGITNNFSGIAGKFLSGETSAMDLINSGSPAESMLGLALMRKGASAGIIQNTDARTRLLRSVIEDPTLQAELRKMAIETSGYKIFFEDLNSKLFNPESGIFGSLRKVANSAGRQTTSFDETSRLINQVFGENGVFFALFRRIGQVFGVGDPMTLVVDAIGFMTDQFKKLTDYINSDSFKGFLQFFKGVFDTVSKLFKSIYDSVISGAGVGDINEQIKNIGSSVRQFIQNIGKSIRDADISAMSSGTGSVLTTMMTEIGKTLGILIKEVFMTLVNKTPEITSAVLPALNAGINSFFTEMFGAFGGKMAKLALSFVPGPIGMLARASAATDVTGGQGWMGIAGALGGAFLPQLIGMGYGKTGDRKGLLGGLRFLARGSRFVERFRGDLADPERKHAAIYGLLSRFDNPINEALDPYRINKMPYDVRIAKSFYDRRYLRGDSYELTSAIRPGRFTPYGLLPPTPPSSQWPNPYAAEMMRRSQLMREEIERGRMAMKQDFERRRRGRFGSFIGHLPQYDPYAGGPDPFDWSNPFPDNMDDMPTYDPYAGGKDPWDWSTENKSTMSREERRRRRLKMLGKGRRMRMLRRTGMIAGAGGLIFGGGAAFAAAAEGAGGEAFSTKNVIDQAGNIAMMLPGWGPLIGGVLKVTALLMDKGVRDAMNQYFIVPMNQLFTNMLNGITGAFRGAMDKMGNVFNWIGQQFNFFQTSGGSSNKPWIVNILGELAKKAGITVPPLPFYSGLNYAGPAMALEAKMSGNRPMVVNDGEFVIPRDGFGTLTGVVEDRVRRSLNDDAKPAPVSFAVTIQLNNPVMLGNNRDLVNALRQPILDVLDDAWQQVSQGTIRRPSVAG